MAEKVNLLGFPVDMVDMESALALANGYLSSGESHRIITLNPEMIILSRRDAELRRSLEGADAYLPETAGVAWAIGIKKLPGIDFMYELLGLANSKGYSVYFLGARPGIAEKAAEKTLQKYPAMKVAGTRDGYFTEDDERVVVAEIAAADPDILLVAMGTRPQESFITRNRDALKARIIMGVGGSFDVLSGEIKRATNFFRDNNLEWLYRLLTQPQRLWRMASTLPHFAALVLLGRIRQKGA